MAIEKIGPFSKFLGLFVTSLVLFFCKGKESENPTTQDERVAVEESEKHATTKLRISVIGTSDLHGSLSLLPTFSG